MRILIHSNAPWMGTGYGQQAALLGPRLAQVGHQVAYSAFAGLHGNTMQWNGLTCYPGGRLDFGVDVIGAHAARHRADVIITMMDFYKLGPVAQQLQSLPVLALLPVDCHPVSALDQGALFASHALPVAVSRFGQRELRKAGFDARYVPHMVDTRVFKPEGRESRMQRRAGYGYGPETFVIGICAANNDTMRKGFAEQFEAFRRFSARRPTARLMLHTDVQSRRGLDLTSMLMDFQISDRVMISDSYGQVTGEIDDAIMSEWMNTIDVLSLCSLGEGFGVPLIEAQACGTPVIATRGSAMAELSAKGWRVKAEPYWNPVHRAWWDRPLIGQIERAYEEAYQEWNDQEEFESVRWTGRQIQSQELAEQYDADTVVSRFWLPLLRSIPRPE